MAQLTQLSESGAIELLLVGVDQVRAWDDTTGLEIGLLANSEATAATATLEGEADAFVWRVRLPGAAGRVFRVRVRKNAGIPRLTVFARVPTGDGNVSVLAYEGLEASPHDATEAEFLVGATNTDLSLRRTASDGSSAVVQPTDQSDVAIPVPAAANFKALRTVDGIDLSWDRPSHARYAFVRLVRKADATPASPDDGTVLFEGDATSHRDTGVSGTQHYALFSYALGGEAGGVATATAMAGLGGIRGAAGQAGAVVVLTSSDGVARTSVADANGQYAFANLPTGTYALEATAGGVLLTPSSPSVAVGETLLSVDFTVRYPGYFAEGVTSYFFDTQFAVFNPDPVSSASISTRYSDADGGGASGGISLAPLGRLTIDPKTFGLTQSEFASTFKSDRPVVIDRTVRWGSPARYGAHASASIPELSQQWFLAEGATHSGFQLFYLLLNPNDRANVVGVKFLRPAPLAPIVNYYELSPHSRATVWVNYAAPELAATDVSAVVTSLTGLPLLVERALYRDAPGQAFKAGHEGAAVSSPATQWFLAEGATGPYFDLFVLIANPADRAATVEARYLLNDGTTLTKTYEVAANSRFNIWVDHEEVPAGSGRLPLSDVAVSTTVTSLNGVPIIVERAMWWPGGPGTWAEAHSSPGATRSAYRWAMAEGESTSGPNGVDTFVLIANTSPSPAAAMVTLAAESGRRMSKLYTLPANSRTNVWVNHDFPEFAGLRFGTIVESVTSPTIPFAGRLVVERAMYWNSGGRPWVAGSNALATPLPGGPVRLASETVQ